MKELGQPNYLEVFFIERYKSIEEHAFLCRTIHYERGFHCWGSSLMEVPL